MNHTNLSVGYGRAPFTEQEMDAINVSIDWHTHTYTILRSVLFNKLITVKRVIFED